MSTIYSEGAIGIDAQDFVVASVSWCPASSVLRFLFFLSDSQYRTGGMTDHLFRHTPQQDV